MVIPLEYWVCGVWPVARLLHSFPSSHGTANADLVCAQVTFDASLALIPLCAPVCDG